MSKEIDAGDLTIGEVFSEGQTYDVTYYQREYKWDSHVLVLYKDLATAFESNTDGYYFLGTVVVDQQSKPVPSLDDRAVNFVIDGQQRLTTLTLLFIALSQALVRQGNQSQGATVMRESILDGSNLILGIPQHETTLRLLTSRSAIWDEKNLSGYEGVKLFDNYLVLQNEVEKAAFDLYRFYSWLRSHVQIAKIEAKDSNSSYTIFETMNDRGLPLASHEIWKGYILSNITDEAQRANAKIVWDKTSQLIESGAKEYRNAVRNQSQPKERYEPLDKFLEIFLNARYAKPNGVLKAQNEPDKDDLRYEEIRPTSIHRWTRHNAKSVLGLSSSEDFSELIEDAYFYATQYVRLLRIASGNAEDKFSIFYETLLEPKSGGGLFFGDDYRIVLLSAIHRGHDDDAILDAWTAVTTCLDILWARAFWDNRSTLTKDVALKLAQILRHKLVIDDSDRRLFELNRELSKDLNSKWAQNGPLIESSKAKRMATRFLLRLSLFVETEAGRSSSYLDYHHKKSTVLELEHILPEPEYDNHPFGTSEAYKFARSKIGALTLLTKSINGSLQDKAPKDKILNYKGFLLTELIHDENYRSGSKMPLQSGVGLTKVSNFFEKNSISPEPGSHIDNAYFNGREKLYRSLALLSWRQTRLHDLYNGDWVDLAKKSNNWVTLDSNEPLRYSYTWVDLFNEHSPEVGIDLLAEKHNEKPLGIRVRQGRKVKIGDELINISGMPSLDHFFKVTDEDGGLLFLRSNIAEKRSKRQNLFAKLVELVAANERMLTSATWPDATVISDLDLNRSAGHERLKGSLYVSKAITEEEIQKAIDFAESFEF